MDPIKYPNLFVWVEFRNNFFRNKFLNIFLMEKKIPTKFNRISIPVYFLSTPSPELINFIHLKKNTHINKENNKFILEEQNSKNAFNFETFNLCPWEFISCRYDRLSKCPSRKCASISRDNTTCKFEISQSGHVKCDFCYCIGYHHISYQVLLWRNERNGTLCKSPSFMEPY